MAELAEHAFFLMVAVACACAAVLAIGATVATIINAVEKQSDRKYRP